jgi:tRNA-2-methylthio-N6-dimethylallyladenosine synthase
MRKSVYVFTYGCQMNVHDSEKMLGILSENGYILAEKPEKADLIIFNTCAIREKAEQKFYSQLGRIKRLKTKNKDLNIAVAGCVAQGAKEGLIKRAPYVDFILGPQNIYRIQDMISGKTSQAAFEDNEDLAYIEFNAMRNSCIKAWVSIMYGCNNFCSYCVVPYTRGREVSRPSSSILDEIRNLKLGGYKEVTLLGQNVNSYRSDCGFTGLLLKIDKIGIDRVRFVTSHPRDLSPELINAIADLPSVCEHIHLPLQAGSDSTLRMMNRGYVYREYLEKVNMLSERIPGLAITSDIIAGFPGETDEDFLCTVKALREIEFDGIFAFKYSPRKGTGAYQMENDVPDDVKSERLTEVLKIQEDITFKKNRQLEGTVQEVLLEGCSDTDKSMLTGRTRTNKIVTIADSGEREGSLVQVRIQRARPHSLCGVNINLKPAAV